MAENGGKKKVGIKERQTACSVKQSAAFMKNVMHSTANRWVRFLPPKQHDDLSVLPSRNTEASSADSEPGMEGSERLGPLWSPARGRRSTPIVHTLPPDTQKGCGKEKVSRRAAVRKMNVLPIQIILLHFLMFSARVSYEWY